MKPVAKKATPAAIAVLRQATALFPKRKKLSDGLLPSVAHQKQSPNSDHNTGLAVDLTHDPENGVDCAQIFEKLKEDKRVSYLIFNKKIWSRQYAKRGNRPYSGSNPHTKHLHISIDPDMANDTSPWFWWMNQPKIVNQVKAALQPQPKKKVAKGVNLAPNLVSNLTPICTCCKVHNTKRKAI
jgi:hypothetical protein